MRSGLHVEETTIFKLRFPSVPPAWRLPAAVAALLLLSCRGLGSASAQSGSLGPAVSVQGSPVAAAAQTPGTGRVVVYTDWKALLSRGLPSQVTVTLQETNGPARVYYVFTPGAAGVGDPGVDSTGAVTFTNLQPAGYSVRIQALGGGGQITGSAQRDVAAIASTDQEVYLPVHPAQIGLPPPPPAQCGSTNIVQEYLGEDHWVEIDGTPPLEAYGSVRGSWFADTDLPADHQGHDRNFYLSPDDDYAGLLSDSNDTDTRYDGRKMMECEWDSGFNPNHTSTSFPVSGWPIVGDRAWVSGPWIYDCDHTYSGFQIPYHTEFHVWAKSPTPMAVAFTRFDPTIFEPTDVAPSLTYRTYLTVRPGFGAQDYVFDVPMPPEPPGGVPVYRLDQPAPSGVTVNLTPIVPQGVLQVSDPISMMSADSVQARIARLRVHVELSSGAGLTGFSGTITAGWWQPQTTVSYRSAQVSFQELRINHPHAYLLSSSASWWLWVQAGDQWLDWTDLGALHAITSPETLPVDKTTTPFFVLDGSAANQSLGGLWLYGLPKSYFAADVDDTGWRSGDMDYDFGCVTCLSNVIENEGLGEIPLAIPDNSSNSIPVPTGGSAPFGPLISSSPIGQSNPADTVQGDLALSGTITTLGAYPAGMTNPRAPG